MACEVVLERAAGLRHGPADSSDDDTKWHRHARCKNGGKTDLNESRLRPKGCSMAFRHHVWGC